MLSTVPHEEAQDLSVTYVWLKWGLRDLFTERGQFPFINDRIKSQCLLHKPNSAIHNHLLSFILTVFFSPRQGLIF